MKLIQDVEFRYNTRVHNVLKMDVQMGLYTEWKSEVSGMCREMLDCMLTYFPKIHYVQIKESEEETEVYFNENPEVICSKEEINRYMKYPDGWHVVNINTSEMSGFKARIKEIISNDMLFKETILEQYKDDKERLAKVLYQYGLTAPTLKPHSGFWKTRPSDAPTGKSTLCRACFSVRIAAQKCTSA